MEQYDRESSLTLESLYGLNGYKSVLSPQTIIIHPEIRMLSNPGDLIRLPHICLKPPSQEQDHMALSCSCRSWKARHQVIEITHGLVLNAQIQVGMGSPSAIIDWSTQGWNVHARCCSNLTVRGPCVIECGGSVLPSAGARCVVTVPHLTIFLIGRIAQLQRSWLWLNYEATHYWIGTLIKSYNTDRVFFFQNLVRKEQKIWLDVLLLLYMFFCGCLYRQKVTSKSQRRHLC